MTELRTDAAEQALREHVAAVRGEPADEATGYHESMTELRRELVRSALGWEQTQKPYFEQAHQWLSARRVAQAKGEPEPTRPPQSVFDADAGCMMAGSYAYTLAAVLRVAEQEFGHEMAHALACVADDILINGDDCDRNADVTPREADEAAEATS